MGRKLSECEKGYRRWIADAVKETQADAKWIYKKMPRYAGNEAQIKLMKKHGSPYTFGKGCVAAIGEISILEAQQATEKYFREWNQAA